MRHVKHEDATIVAWAKAYLKTRSTITLEKELSISHSTTWWCFTRRLEGIDKELYEEVIKKLASNKKTVRK